MNRETVILIILFLFAMGDTQHFYDVGWQFRIIFYSCVVLFFIYLGWLAHVRRKSAIVNFKKLVSRYFGQDSVKISETQARALVNGLTNSKDINKVLFSSRIADGSNAILFNYLNGQALGEGIILVMKCDKKLPYAYILGPYSDFDAYSPDKEMYAVHDIRTANGPVRIVVQKGANIEAYEFLEKSAELEKLILLMDRFETDIEFNENRIVLWCFYGDRLYLGKNTVDHIEGIKKIILDVLAPKLLGLGDDISVINEAFKLI